MISSKGTGILITNREFFTSDFFSVLFLPQDAQDAS